MLLKSSGDWGLAIRYEGVKADIQGVLHKANRPKEGPAYDMFVKADALRLSNCHKESIGYYLNSLLINRDNAEAYFGLGVAYKHVRNYDKAVESLEKAKKLSYFDYKIHYELGICYLINGCFCPAIKHLVNSIRLNPKNLEAQIQLGMAHEMIEEDDMALMIYQKIIETNPSFLRAYAQKAALYMNLGMYQESAQVFRKILKINPDYYRAYLGIGICCDKFGKQVDAVRYYKKFLTLKPRSKNAQDVRKRLEVIKQEYSSRDCHLQVV